MEFKVAIIVASVLGLAFGVRAVHAYDKAVSVAFARSDPTSHTVVDHTAWARVLARRLQAAADGINRFDYAKASQSDKIELAAYLIELQRVSPAGLNASEQHAYWINFYNALTVKVILEHYPVRSIRDISSGLLSFGPWDLELASVDGHKLTLHNVEDDILRANWRDPRVHYALNCASLGCPNLQPVPYSGAHLDAEVDAASRAFINHPRGVELRGGRLSVSKIYRWYAEDFGGSDTAILAHLRKYASPALAARLAGVSSIDSYQYDWRLNAPGILFASQ